MTTGTTIGCDIQGPHTHSPEEAAQMIGGVSPRTLRDWVSARRVPFTRVGREIRFTCEQVAEIIAAGAYSPTPPRPDARRKTALR